MRQIIFGLIVFGIGCSGTDIPAPTASPGPAVVLPTVASVELEDRLKHGVLAAQDSVYLFVVVRGSNGNALNGRDITFTSSDESVATVNASGYVHGLSAGKTTITATSEGKYGQVTMQIFLSDPCPPSSSVRAECVGSEVYSLVLYNDQPLPLRTPWGNNKWSYEIDAGTWILTGGTLTILADGTFRRTLTHRSGSDLIDIERFFGTYTRSSLASLQLLMNQSTYSGLYAGNRLIVPFGISGTFTFER